MSWLDSKYISLLSNRLLRFRRKSPVLYNFRCPICSDSEKSKSKARGYIYQKSGQFWFTCHNCGVSLSFPRFLKQLDSGLYDSYLTELYSGKRPNHDSFEIPKPKKLDNKSLAELKLVWELPRKHPARQYLESRKIPRDRMLYYCSEFKTWVNSQVPDKFEDLEFEEDRIIIPFFDQTKKMFAFQGRSLNPDSKLRYVSITLDETKPKFYGLDMVDFNRKFYVFEGPFDSMFLPNAIASGGGKLTSELIKLGVETDNAIICYDNEKRNKDVVANIHKAVKNNYNVVIWPSSHVYKDINEMILGGYTIEKIQNFLNSRIFKGLSAQAEFKNWVSNDDRPKPRG